MMALNLSREIQMIARSPQYWAQPKRPAAWTYQSFDTLRHRIIQRAGRLTMSQYLQVVLFSLKEAFVAATISYHSDLQERLKVVQRLSCALFHSGDLRHKYIQGLKNSRFFHPS